MKTMTIRNIPDDVASWLAEQARTRRASVNATTVSVLTSAAIPNSERKRRELGGLFGSWSKEEGRRFDKATKEAFGRVRVADWSVQK